MRLTRCLAGLLLALTPNLSNAAETHFKFGGYVKMDALYTVYENGDVGAESPLRDFHFPGAIPVGSADRNVDLDMHAKETRFNFETTTKLDGGREVRGFLEFDFILSPAGNERVSNSFNPRLRHALIETGPWLAGQTWSNFMVVVVPDELDFSGAPEGLVFIRQPLVRFSTNQWQFSLENPETVVNPHGDASRVETESGTVPDFTARYNVSRDWGRASITGLARVLDATDPTISLEERAFGFGISGGGEIKVGERDDVRFQATAGNGLGRYVGLNFVNSAVVDTSGATVNLELISNYLGYVAYRHFWNDKWRSSASVSLFRANNPSGVSAPTLNKEAQSYSANLLYSPFAGMTVGGEYIYGRRVLEDGTDGAFHRVQFAFRWDFNYRGDAPAAQ